MKYQLTQCQKIWMLLLFPCPSTIQVASCPVIFRLTSSTLASSGSCAAAWFPLSTPSTAAPRLSSTRDSAPSPIRPAARGDHRCEPVQGVHCRGRHAWQPKTSRQTARPRHDSHAGHHMPRQSSCFQASLVLRLASFFTMKARAAENSPWNCFSYPAGRFFACPGPAAPSQPPQRRYPQCQRKLTMSFDL
jgi:hypothetical protein